jgi:hypothetical protein
MSKDCLINQLEVTIDSLRQEVERLREVLESIANNTCCDKCNQASLVARAALAPQIEGK